MKMKTPSSRSVADFLSLVSFVSSGLKGPRVDSCTNTRTMSLHATQKMVETKTLQYNADVLQLTEQVTMRMQHVASSAAHERHERMYTSTPTVQSVKIEAENKILGMRTRLDSF